MIDAYYFCLGGAVGKDSGVARPVGYRCAADKVPDAIERLLRKYLATRNEEENLRTWFARHNDEQLRITLAGEPVEAVERDLPAGRPASGGE